jgi:uncharacterized protein (TIGR02466 family)
VSTQALLHSALQAHQSGNLPLAKGLVDQILLNEPQNAFGLHIAGLVTRDTGDFIQAEQFFKASFQDSLPGRTKAEFSNNLARLYDSQGLFDLALQVATLGTQSDPSFKPVRRLRSQILSKVGLHQEAVKEATLATEQAPTAPDWLVLANAYKAALDWSGCKNATEALLAIAPQHVLGRQLRAITVGHLSPLTSAEPYFAELADNSDAMCNLANMQLEAGQIAKAEETFNRALGLDPLSIGVLISQVEFFWMSGQKDVALKTLQTASQTRLDDQPLQIAIANTAQKLGQFELAHAALHHALTISPDNPSLLMQHASLYCEEGLLNEATDLAKTAIAAWPENEAILRKGATILLRAGDFDFALRLCVQGLQMRPWSYEWIALYASTQRALNKPEYRYWFNFDAFIKNTSIDTPEGYSSVEAFNLDLATWLHRQHVLREHPLNNSVRGGSQVSLPVYKGRVPILDAFHQAISGPINRYIDDLKKEIDHPFAKRMSKDWRLSGLWSVRLRNGGNHVNHIHPDGWISCVYYVEVPRNIAANSNRDGWIGFGAPRFSAPNIDHEVWIEPKPGRLALFPSYAWHGVRPFHDASERLTMAFDVVPL